MLKLDFINNIYTLDEVIDAYTDGSIDNFKGDEEFLNFLISYSLGENLVGQEAQNFKEYAEYDGILNVMRLDEYNYFGEKLYKIYEICGKDKTKFMQTCDLIGQYSINHVLEKETIDRNLSLKEPVPFIDDEIVLSSGIKPVYNPKERYTKRYGLDFDDEKEYKYELERSLRHRINESIKKNGDDVPLFEEMPSYIEKQRIEKEEEEQKKVKDDYVVDINNLYFGSEILDLSGGVLNMNVKTVSFFEYTNFDILKYHTFRSMPLGDYCLIDDEGQIYIPNKILESKNVKIGPNSPIRSVNIANIPTIFENALSKLEEEPIENEEIILTCKGTYELLQDKQTITFGEIKKYEKLIRTLYEVSYGDIFKEDQNRSYETNEENQKGKN